MRKSAVLNNNKKVRKKSEKKMDTSKEENHYWKNKITKVLLQHNAEIIAYINLFFYNLK
jgi:hypothetical protein